MTKDEKQKEELESKKPMELRKKVRQKSLAHLFTEIHQDRDEDLADLFSSDPEFKLWSKEHNEEDLAQQMEDDYYQQMMQDLLDARDEQEDVHLNKSVELAKKGISFRKR